MSVSLVQEALHRAPNPRQRLRCPAGHVENGDLVESGVVVLDVTTVDEKTTVTVMPAMRAAVGDLRCHTSVAGRCSVLLRRPPSWNDNRHHPAHTPSPTD